MDNQDSIIEPVSSSPQPKWFWPLTSLILLLVVGTGIWLWQYFSTTTQPDTQLPSQTPATAVEFAEVIITAEGFNPQTLTINQGTAVTFINQDSDPHQVASDPHPTHTNLPDLVSDVLASGDSFTFIFDQLGSFTYHDHLNPFDATGTIEVN